MNASSLTSRATPPTIGVLERNRSVGQRIARVLKAGAGLESVACETDPASLRAALSDRPRLVACDVTDLDLVLEWRATRYPDLRVIAWFTDPSSHVLELARGVEDVVSLVAWPSHVSMPRAWELLLGTRGAVARGLERPSVGDLLSWGASSITLKPRTSAERDRSVERVGLLAEAAGCAPRLATKVGEVSYELLMNAMYDAPVDQYGEPKYAFDRSAEISLEPEEAPEVRFCTDGCLVAVEVTDPFGRLRREHVFDGISRGLAGADVASGPVVDTSGGGAGLGLFRVHAAAHSVVVAVEPGQSSRVTALFDMDISAREARAITSSLHFL